MQPCRLRRLCAMMRPQIGSPLHDAAEASCLLKFWLWRSLFELDAARRDSQSVHKYCVPSARAQDLKADTLFSHSPTALRSDSLGSQKRSLQSAHSRQRAESQQASCLSPGLKKERHAASHYMCGMPFLQIIPLLCYKVSQLRSAAAAIGLKGRSSS